MYTYEWDSTTGGYLLKTTPSIFSKEPRPVYYKELDILGLEKYWNYAKDDSKPYMWAEANSYYYRGVLVAKTKGGSLYTAPKIKLIDEPESNGGELRFVNIDLMVEKNKTIMDALVNETIKRAYNTYIDYQNKVDLFYVAFSGGKDSVVLFDIIQKTLPHNEYCIVFGDTGMEFSDTYTLIEDIKLVCKNIGVEFYASKSKLSPDYTWKKFGPPAQTLRWCCSVHKTSPQILMLRKITKKPNFKGMAFTGIRRDESASRSNYDTVSLSEKHEGQYSFNVIDEWNTAELFLYIYGSNLLINEAYKKGNSRVGCLVCPMAALKNEYMKNCSYIDETSNYFNLIRNCNGKDFNNDAEFKNYLNTGGWKARKNGRELDRRLQKYIESNEGNKIVITVIEPNTNWKVWIKTIGQLIINNDIYKIIYNDNEYQFEYIEKENGYTVKIDDYIVRSVPVLSKLFKQVFRKAAYCVKCGVCEANCKYGYLKMDGEDIEIDSKCISCASCHKVDKGCLVYKSVMLPKGGSKDMGKIKSLNSYSNHGVKMEWMLAFFRFKDNFKTEHKLGSNMYDFFKRFLKDAELIEKDKFSDIAKIIDHISLKNDIAWAIMLTNLSYAPQVRWYITNIKWNVEYSRGSIIAMLDDENVKEVAAKQMLLAYKRILSTPFGTKLGLGFCKVTGNKLVSITRGTWSNPDSRVILYGLYKFAEVCGEYYQLTLTRLMNYKIDSDGVSPSRIFGLDRETMEKILNGLSVNYPDFISIAFTLDLDNITLRSDKTSKDVLGLF